MTPKTTNDNLRGPVMINCICLVFCRNNHDEKKNILIDGNLLQGRKYSSSRRLETEARQMNCSPYTKSKFFEAKLITE